MKVLIFSPYYSSSNQQVLEFEIHMFLEKNRIINTLSAIDCELQKVLNQVWPHSLEISSA